MTNGPPEFRRVIVAAAGGSWVIMRLFHLAALATVLTLSCGEAADATVGPRSGLKAVRFAGTTVLVPADWPVINLTAHPHTCMRYDRHAVYLGDPGPHQNCPAAAVGRTDTVQITSTGKVIRTTAQGDPDVDSSYDADDPRPLPPPRPRSTDRPVQAAAMYSGLGFDTCAAPSTDTMQAWAGTSPYHAVGVYIGGIDRACPDGNLTPSWFQTVSKQGWKIFPIYVGLQAPCWKASDSGRPTVIDSSRPWAQGLEAADDAAARAAHFGIAPGSPIYFDMEIYPRAVPDCTQNVQAFLSAWTGELHNRGFISGIYSSSRGAIADMAQVYDSTTVYRADVAWFAHWDKVPQPFGDKTLNDRFWPGPRRIKQYRGEHNETYGGQKLNVDQNVLNAPVAALQ
jgi:hypothetical protein